MPVTQSATKALRRDRGRAKINLRRRRVLKETLKKAKTKTTPKNLSAAFKRLDLAAKKKIIHANKADRLKSRLVRLIKQTA